MGSVQDGTASSSQWWWVPNAVLAAAGVALVAFGVFGHYDQAELVTAGLVTIAGAGGHAIGKLSPTP